MNSPSHYQSSWKSLLFPKTLIRSSSRNSIHPITEKKDEKAESLEVFEKIPDIIFDSLPDFVAVIDKQGNVKETNAAFRKFVDSRKKSGTSAELNFTEILDEKHHENFSTALLSSLFPVSLGGILNNNNYLFPSLTYLLLYFCYTFSN